MTRILIVEDEQHLADGLRFNLEAEGYDVDIASDGETALELLSQGQEPFDAVVLDVMLPGIDGFDVATSLRSAGQFVPIMMLTARSRPEDILKGFESGADDYLPKPFELSILVARLNGLIRRMHWQQLRQASVGDPTSQVTETDLEQEDSNQLPSLNLFRFDDKTIDFDGLELKTPERTVHLTLMEADLLRYLVLHAGRVVSRKSILEDVWNLKEDTDTRAIDNFVVRLRRYIELDPSRPRYLTTVRGVGYRFIPEP
jgi:DNA-binding response OmpR family regulator